METRVKSQGNPRCAIHYFYINEQENSYTDILFVSNSLKMYLKIVTKDIYFAFQVTRRHQ